MVVIDKYNSTVNKVHSAKFKSISTVKSIQDLTSINGDIMQKEYLERDDFRQILKINLSEKSKQCVLDTIKQIEKIDGVLWAGVNSYDSPDELDLLETTYDKEVYEGKVDRPAVSVPVAIDGELFKKQWGLGESYGINALKAWSFHTIGSRDVRVGVIDSGIADHEDLNSNVVSGWDFYNDNEITSDDPSGHGTHVAGTIGASGKSTDGAVGVNWKVTLVPLQVVDPNNINSWPMDGVIKAITWAINNNIDILNYSGGGTSDDPLRKAAINNYNGLFVCAAGNNGRNIDNTPYYPACYSQGQTFSNRVISVGAINSSGKICSFSNYGAKSVSVFAPGENIWSTYPTNLKSSGYIAMDGTSMATPHVTGIAALVYSMYEGNTFSLSDSYIAAQVKSLIIHSTDIEDTYSDKCVSSGYVNAEMTLDNVPLKRVMSGFGYDGTLNKWVGKVDLLVDDIESFYYNSIDMFNITGGAELQFSIGTEKVLNSWTKITGTVKVELKNSSGEVMPIGNGSSHTCQVSVGIVSNASLSNSKFTINTKNLQHDTYTLSLSSTITRGSNTYYDSASFAFIVW